MSTKLDFHLYPKGRSALEPDLMPNVLDSDGNTVVFTSEKRKTSEGTVVNLGTSPNSNNGDPLRTAFAKVNNFIEASYWTNEGINQKFRDIDSELREGIFIYTDSDQRVNLSLLDNSKLYFRGTPNQIEMNITRLKSANNPHDFDSEVNLFFQLTEKVDISQLHVLEHATFDSDVDIKGKLVVDSDVILSADLRVDSDVIIKGAMSVGQEVHLYDDVRFYDNAQFDSDIQVSGKVKTDVIQGESADTVTIDDKLTVRGKTQFDSDVSIAGTLDVGNLNVASNLTVGGNARFDSDVSVAGAVSALSFKSTSPAGIIFEDDVVFQEHVTFDSDITISGTADIGNLNVTSNLTVGGNARFDSDINIIGKVNVDVITSNTGGQVLIDDHLRVSGNARFDSDVSVGGHASVTKTLSVYQEANFYDDAFFMDNAYFDSDVMIAGNLTVNGTTTAVNSQNLEVRDNLIVLNYNQTTPFNDIGLIFTRYDSDNVSATNWNTAFVWDELTDQFIFAQSQSSGITPNPTLTQQYMHIGQTVEFFDSENNPRMIWDKSQATLRILFEDGTDAFKFNADTGQLTGDGTIDAGFF